MFRGVGVMVCLAPLAAFAGDGSVNLREIEGHYRERVPNGDSSGEKYTTFNTLQIARVEKDVVYFVLELTFFNGHMCELSGVADSEKGALVYREATHNPKEPCELRIRVQRGRVVMEDVGGFCRGANCGARGGFDDVDFAMTRRRAITPRDRQKAIEEYKEALKERDKAQTKP